MQTHLAEGTACAKAQGPEYVWQVCKDSSMAEALTKVLCSERREFGFLPEGERHQRKDLNPGMTGFHLESLLWQLQEEKHLRGEDSTYCTKLRFLTCSHCLQGVRHRCVCVCVCLCECM